MTVCTPLVRRGEDGHLPRDRETGRPQHRLIPVYTEMLLQVARDFPAMDPRSLTMSEIRFFYEGLRAELKAHTKPRDPPRFPRR